MSSAVSSQPPVNVYSVVQRQQSIYSQRQTAGLQDRSTASERLTGAQQVSQRIDRVSVPETVQRQQAYAQKSNAGLQDRSTASERLGSIRQANQSVEREQVGEVVQRQETYAQKSNAGLQDRSTASERQRMMDQAIQRVVENHGSQARQSTVEALTNNSKIMNIPVAERGSLVNTHA